MSWLGCSTTTPRPAARQRGSVLVLVLGVTAIVGVIGLSSLLAVRVQHRGVQLRLDAAQGQLAADTGLQLIHARLSTDADWRAGRPHDQWSAVEIWDPRITVHYKLLDEGPDNDADLADDESDPARLVVRAACGQAVRLASIQLAGEPLLGPELITNADLEQGTVGFGVDTFLATVNANGDRPHAGALNLVLSSSLLNTANWRQHLDGKLDHDTTYRLTAWMRTNDADATVRLGLLQQSGLLPTLNQTTATVSSEWTRVTHTLTTDFSGGTPSTLYLFGGRVSGSGALHVDDVSVRQLLSDSLPVTAGSYRREVDD